jgi:hypothetical protein
VGKCCTGYWRANEPYDSWPDSPPLYEVGVGSTADGYVWKTDCDNKRQFDCETHRGSNASVHIIDGEEKHFRSGTVYENGEPVGVTYDAWFVNEWHGITGGPDCDVGTSWSSYEMVDDIIRGSTGSICHHCENNSDCSNQTQRGKTMTPNVHVKV